MIKSMFKRASLSIRRKMSKTIVLAIVMFIMANLVLSSIAIKNAVKESTKFAKQSLGSTVYLAADMDKIREEAQANATTNNDGGPVRIKLERPVIPVDMVKSIADSTYVKDYTYGINATAQESDFEALESESDMGGFAFSNSSGGTTTVNPFGNMSIIGINSYAFISQVQDKSMELVDGTYFDEKTNDQVIISNDLAAQNDFEVGDKITLINNEVDMESMMPGEDINVTSSKEYTLEIIGIYEVDSDNFNGNTIYMNVDSASQFLKEESFNDGNYGVDNISYFLNDPEDSDIFIAESKNKYPNLEEDKLKLDINSEDYDKMAGPIEQVGSFADTVLWIVIIASIAIITLIINNNIKDRKYEIGVLMSLGSTKKNIIASILLELIIIGSVGFLLSMPTSYFLADSMGRSVLEKQLKTTEEQNENNFGRPGMGMNRVGGGNFTIGGLLNGTNNSNVETIDSIDVTVKLANYGMLFLIGYLISAVAMIIPSINIVKYEPKTILSGRQ